MYSQKDEDRWILRAVAGMETGRFLDIGAYDGCNYSNTMALIERGWSGVMVEPGLEAFRSLLARHGGNEKLTLVHAAVVPTKSYKSVLTRFWNNDTTYGTTVRSNCDKFREQPFSHGYFCGGVVISDLLNEFWVKGGFDVVSIDTEGTSVDLFEDLRIEMDPVKVVCVEHDGQIDRCLSIAGLSGYRLLAQNSENLIFERQT